MKSKKSTAEKTLTKPTWAPAGKSGVGKSINAASRIVFTLNKGIVTEVFYPREDIACIKDCAFIVTDGKSYFSHEKHDADHHVKMVKNGIPAYIVTNTSHHKKYVIQKEIIADPLRSVLLQKITFKPAVKKDKLSLYISLAPHLGDTGAKNDGWLGKYHGNEMLFASNKGLTLAMACSHKWLKRSVGNVGVSDGYHDLKTHHKMKWENQQAYGNIALTAQIDLEESNTFVIAIGFGRTESEAGNRAWSSLLDGFEDAKEDYISEWEKWQKNLKTDFGTIAKIPKISTAVLMMSEAQSFPGGIVASLATPWGFAQGDDDDSGYHVVWPRDLVEASGGFVAVQSKHDAVRIINYLISTQEEDGRWAQNMWLGGVKNWSGLQMDQIALPICITEKCYRKGYIDKKRLDRYWPYLKKAAAFLVSYGPSTKQDRWEEEPGLTPFTLAAEISGLIAAAILAEEYKETAMAKYCRETADYWNSNIEKWLYVTDTKTSKELDIEGYYIRINSYQLTANEAKHKILDLKNHTDGKGKIELGELVSVDALALVRFGLRAADDPKIVSTIKVIDAKLKVETPTGPCWHRYNNDGYGEDKHGNPFKHAGIGRAWPLLTGERGHYEVAAGNITEAKKLLKAMESFSENGFLPEQIWDTDDIPEKDLYFGRPSGSAMPLTWTHAEYLKLCCSIQDKYVFDMAEYTFKRYVTDQQKSSFDVWKFHWPIKSMDAKNTLRIEVFEEAVVHWSSDDWATKNETSTKDSGILANYADIKPSGKGITKIEFTFYWKKSKSWESKNFHIDIVHKEDQ